MSETFLKSQLGKKKKKIKFKRKTKVNKILSSFITEKTFACIISWSVGHDYERKKL